MDPKSSFTTMNSSVHHGSHFPWRPVPVDASAETGRENVWNHPWGAYLLLVKVTGHHAHNSKTVLLCFRMLPGIRIAAVPPRWWNESFCWNDAHGAPALVCQACMENNWTLNAPAKWNERRHRSCCVLERMASSGLPIQFKPPAPMGRPMGLEMSALSIPLRCHPSEAGEISRAVGHRLFTLWRYSASVGALQRPCLWGTALICWGVIGVPRPSQMGARSCSHWMIICHPLLGKVENLDPHPLKKWFMLTRNAWNPPCILYYIRKIKYI